MFRFLNRLNLDPLNFLCFEQSVNKCNLSCIASETLHKACFFKILYNFSATIIIIPLLLLLLLLLNYFYLTHPFCILHFDINNSQATQCTDVKFKKI